MNKLKIIMNPPYDRNLHLDILDKVVEKFPENKIVNLSPMRWIQDPLAEYKKNNDWNRFKNIRERIENVEEISAHDASDIFNADIKINLGIYTIRNGGWVNPYKNNLLVKILKKSKGIPTDKVKNSKDKCFLLITSIVGGHSGLDNIFTKSSLAKSESTYGKFFVNGKSELNGLTVSECKSLNKKSVHGNSDDFLCVSFDTKEEVENFYKFTYSRLFLYSLKKSTVDVHINTNNLPFMPTYTYHWTDEMLYKYFDLTEDEIKTIEEEEMEKI